MADAADEAKDPTVTTQGDVKRDGEQIANHDVAGDVKPKKWSQETKDNAARVRAENRAAKGPANATEAQKQTEAKALKGLKKQLTGLLGGPAMIFTEMG